MCLLLDDLKFDDNKFHNWTGFPNYLTFKVLYDYLEAIALDKKVWREAEMGNSNQNSRSKPGSSFKLTP